MSIRKPNSDERYEDVGAPYECSWRFIRCAKSLFMSYPQKTRLRSTVLSYIFFAIADFFSDWVVFILEMTSEESDVFSRKVAYSLLAVLAISALNSTIQGVRKVQREFHRVWEADGT